MECISLPPADDTPASAATNQEWESSQVTILLLCNYLLQALGIMCTCVIGFHSFLEISFEWLPQDLRNYHLELVLHENEVILIISGFF